MKQTLKILSVVLASIFLLTGCMPSDTTGLSDEKIDLIQLKPPQEGQETAIITTTLGTITMVLFEKEAPNTVAHFKKLIQEGFYNNKDIFLETGSKSFVTGMDDEEDGKGIVATEDGKPIKCETSYNLWHFSGAVSVLGWDKGMFSKTMLSDSRFFIIGDVDSTEKAVEEMKKYSYPQKIMDAYKKHGGYPQYTGSFTVFGQVIDGMDIVNQISVLANDPQTKKPVDHVIIEKIELSTYQIKQ